MTDPNQAKYFDDALEMFATDGWKAFQKEIVAALSNVSIDGLNNATELHQAKGRVDILRQISSYESALRTSMEQAEEGDEEDS